jgi:hypothetical protein
VGLVEGGIEVGGLEFCEIIIEELPMLEFEGTEGTAESTVCVTVAVVLTVETATVLVLEDGAFGVVIMTLH